MPTGTVRKLRNVQNVPGTHKRPGVPAKPFASAKLALTMGSLLVASCAQLPAPRSASPPIAQAQPAYDLLIRGGTIYDGTGSAPFVGDVGVIGDHIAYVGPSAPAAASRTVDAAGLAVSPGFINMLS